MKIFHHFILLALLGLATSASAQWMWLDKDGHKIFSDRPPPTDIPDDKILKHPHIVEKPLVITADQNGDSMGGSPDANSQNDSAPPHTETAADRELQARKKRAAEAEQARQAANNERQAKARADNCNRAKQGMNTLNSGVRLSRVNDKGEREFLDPADIAAERQRNQELINSECN